MVRQWYDTFVAWATQNPGLAAAVISGIFLVTGTVLTFLGNVVCTYIRFRCDVKLTQIANQAQNEKDDPPPGKQGSPSR